MTVTAQYAAEHFEELVSKVDGGESVEITRPGLATLCLAAEPGFGTTTLGIRDAEGRRILGQGRGELRVPTEAEWAAMDRELDYEMTQAPLATTGDL